ncbi:MAG: pyroglutamyl-peptidase I, partial [Clostridia bacterium]|nr:pyroglutamyl-peptidase I [Clostridia bacterium]
MKLLLTAFDPFGGEKTNPAQQAVGLIPANACGAEVVKLTVPTVFVRSVETVVNAIRSEKPDAVLMIGQAGGRSAVSVERVAININSASIADNEGNRPIEELIEQDAPSAYFSTLPI